jgi:hypothetical protein
MKLIRTAVVAAVCALALARPEAAKTDINVQADKTFSFAGLHTWAWHPVGRGDVLAAVSADTDVKRIAARVEPVLQPAIEREMEARRFSKVEGKADLYLRYYVLATVGQMAQTQGQFLPATPVWGLPPFAPSTSALSIYPVGTLLIDLTSVARDAIVWRGSAQRQLDIERPDAQRREVLERAVRDLIKKLPQAGKP